MKKAFNNGKYVKLQSEKIKERINKFDKLYLEVGGKLFDDYHASRVLPGFEPDSKIKMLLELKDIVEIIICVNSKDIEKMRIRSDHEITYDVEVLRLISELKKLGLLINGVVITLYNGEEKVKKFINQLEKINIKTYIHTSIDGYPKDIDNIVSENGFEKNQYIETSRPLVVVTAPGPGSGKLATCLSQLYHEYKKDISAGYAKYETFPVWNLPLNHPVNVAYEAATADLKDVNMIDTYHLKKYGVTAVNYNRDLEVFPILKEILYKITGRDIYYSPTDMGVNMIGFCIDDDKFACEASKQEIIRRYFSALCDYKVGNSDESSYKIIKHLIDELEIDPEKERKIVTISREISNQKNCPVIALEISDKKIAFGKKNNFLTPASMLILNVIKELSGIGDQLLSDLELESMMKYKSIVNSSFNLLNLNDILLALSVCSANSLIVKEALKCLDKLKGLEAHATFLVNNDDLKTLKRLRINLTCDPEFYLDNSLIDE